MKKAKLTKLGRWDSFVSWEVEHYLGTEHKIDDPWKEPQSLNLKICIVSGGQALKQSLWAESDKEARDLERELQRTIEAYQEMLRQVGEMWEKKPEDPVEKFKRENL